METQEPYSVFKAIDFVPGHRPHKSGHRYPALWEVQPAGTDGRAP